MSEPGTAVDDLFEYITEICFIVLMYDGQLCCGSTLKVNIFLLRRWALLFEIVIW